MKAYDDVFEALLASAGGRVDAGLCRKIRGVLFDGFDPRWLAENQKFDFSFSSPGAKAFRFSVSDYGEKESFEGKLAAIFALLGPRYDAEALARLLGVTRRTREHHQTTFGLEWKPSEPEPRLKVYFEELRHRYSGPARRKLLRLVCAAVGAALPGEEAGADLAAIAVDFLPGRGVMLKSYGYSGWKGLGRGGPFGEFARALSSEKRAFFYKTLRFDGGAALRSQKLYKVYEVRQIEDFGPALLEVYAAVGRFGAAADARGLERLRALAKAGGSLWYPVLCALDLDAGGGARVDSYFSLRPR